ncbi:SPOSA6832_00622 [Sporobolomyces salmonicolor]|uniref:U1 small nuclear ribonucleoprotein C n=1 Tax=Sporidiobolus salmonicolor TaxID=5005 RepID=A0A0D6EH16_SPOSA|nr:SPOSA6832_00622 [Sporobolomyces salmonicolor]
MRVFLTHDSASVRRAHNAGRNHLTNVRDYYASLGNDRAQELIDQITRAYENGGGGQARILQMGPGGLPMGVPQGAIPLGVRPPFPPHLRAASIADPPLSVIQVRFAGPPIPGLPGSPAPPPPFGSPFPAPGTGTPGGPPPMRFGSGPIPAQPHFGQGPPPMGMGGPPGMPPPPAFFPQAPQQGATVSSGPSGMGMGGPPPSGPGGDAGGGGGGGTKLINGLNPERARLLGLI